MYIFCSRRHKPRIYIKDAGNLRLLYTEEKSIHLEGRKACAQRFITHLEFMCKCHSSRLKIGMLSTYPPHRCGIGTYTKYFVDELKKSMHVEVIQIDKPSSCNPLYFLELARKVKGNDIVHVQHEYGLFGFNAFLIPYLYIAPLVFLYLRFPRGPRIITTLHTVNQKSLLLFLLPNFFIMRFSDLLIVHTKTAKRLLKRFGIKEKKISVLPHGSYQYPKKLDKNDCKKILGLNDKKVILVFGFVCKWKDYKIIIDILPSLGKETMLLIAGGPRKKKDIPYYRNLTKYVGRLNLERQVLFHGYVEEKMLPIVFNSAEIAVLTNKNTTQSGVLNLILGFKIPAIAPRINYFQEIKDEYDCIDLYKPYDRGDLKKKVAQLLNNNERKAYLRYKAGHYWHERQWKKVASQSITLYSRWTR